MYKRQGRENSTEVSKFRPISLLKVGAKILDKILINRIMHHVFSKDLMQSNQYRFTPQRSTVDAAMAVKEFVERCLVDRGVVVLVSLDAVSYTHLERIKTLTKS